MYVLLEFWQKIMAIPIMNPLSWFMIEMVVNKIATIIRELDNLSKNAFKNLEKSLLMCGVGSAAELANRCLSAWF